MARRAVQSYDWATVGRCAHDILLRDRTSAEGYFLLGLVERVNKHPLKSLQAFEKALELDPDRYDAAIELANQYSTARRNGDAADLLKEVPGQTAKQSQVSRPGRNCLYRHWNVPGGVASVREGAGTATGRGPFPGEPGYLRRVSWENRPRPGQSTRACWSGSLITAVTTTSYHACKKPRISHT